MFNILWDETICPDGTTRDSNGRTCSPEGAAKIDCSTLLPRANLQNCDLRLADLKGVDLSEANLRNANLDGGDLSEANLSYAFLSGATLKSAVLTKVNLVGASMIT